MNSRKAARELLKQGTVVVANDGGLSIRPRFGHGTTTLIDTLVDATRRSVLAYDLSGTLDEEVD